MHVMSEYCAIHNYATIVSFYLDLSAQIQMRCKKIQTAIYIDIYIPIWTFAMTGCNVINCAIKGTHKMHLQ